MINAMMKPSRVPETIPQRAAGGCKAVGSRYLNTFLSGFAETLAVGKDGCARYRAYGLLGPDEAAVTR